MLVRFQVVSADDDRTVVMNVVLPEEPDGYRGRRRRFRFPFIRKAGGVGIPALLVAGSIVVVVVVFAIAQLLPGPVAGIPSGAAPGAGSDSGAGGAAAPPGVSIAGSDSKTAKPARTAGPRSTVSGSGGAAPGPTGTGPYPAWQVNYWYPVGDRVSYAGRDYRCTQAHTSLAGWEPPNTPALWQPVT
jgi:hypothetical protein